MRQDKVNHTYRHTHILREFSAFFVCLKRESRLPFLTRCQHSTVGKIGLKIYSCSCIYSQFLNEVNYSIEQVNQVFKCETFQTGSPEYLQQPDLILLCSPQTQSNIHFLSDVLKHLEHLIN